MATDWSGIDVISTAAALAVATVVLWPNVPRRRPVAPPSSGGAGGLALRGPASPCVAPCAAVTAGKLAGPRSGRRRGAPRTRRRGAGATGNGGHRGAGGGGAVLEVNRRGALVDLGCDSDGDPAAVGAVARGVGGQALQRVGAVGNTRRVPAVEVAVDGWCCRSDDRLAVGHGDHELDLGDFDPVRGRRNGTERALAPWTLAPVEGMTTAVDGGGLFTVMAIPLL